MKDWFFYQERGKTLGPLTAEDLRQRVREGRLRLFDLVYRDGEGVWKMAMDFPELHEEFRNNPVVSADRPWICLQKKEASEEFTTTGPFSAEEIKTAVLAGEIAYTDYAWRHGFKEWKRIGTLPEFNDKVKKVDSLPPIPPESKEELLRAVVQARPTKRVSPPEEIIPAEAGTPDLVVHRQAASFEKPPVSEQKQKAKSSTVKPSIENKRKRSKKSHLLWVDWAIVLILVLGLGASAFYISRQSTLKVEDEQVATTTPAAEIAPPAVEVAPSKAQEPPPVELKPEPHAPTELFLAVGKGKSEQPQIEIRSDGSPDVPIWLQVLGAPGQVADGPAFYRYIKLKASGDVRVPIDLSDLKWPQGRFYLRVETGDLRKETQLQVGTSSPGFKQSINRMRKIYAYAIWKDRLELLKVSQRLEDNLQAALKKKGFSNRGLEGLGAVKLTNGENYVLFDDWWALKEIYLGAQKAPSEELLGRTRRVRDRLATYSVWKYK